MASTVINGESFASELLDMLTEDQDYAPQVSYVGCKSAAKSADRGQRLRSLARDGYIRRYGMPKNQRTDHMKLKVTRYFHLCLEEKCGAAIARRMFQRRTCLQSLQGYVCGHSA